MIPVEKHDHLEPFELLDAFRTNIFVKNTASSINDAIRTIFEDIPEDKGCVVVGFDSEWNVELAPNQRVQQWGKTAVIQIAYQSRVYILQVSVKSEVVISH